MGMPPPIDDSLQGWPPQGWQDPVMLPEQAPPLSPVAPMIPPDTALPEAPQPESPPADDFMSAMGMAPTGAFGLDVPDGSLGGGIDLGAAYRDQFGAAPNLDPEVDDAFAADILEAPSAPQATELAPMSVPEQADFLEARGPEYIQNQQFERDQYQEQLAADAVIEDARKAHENQSILERRMAQFDKEQQALQEESQRLAAMPIERTLPGGPGQQLASLVGAAIAGWFGAKRGDPMAGVKLMNDIIDRHVAGQKDAIAAKRTALGDQRDGLSMRMDTAREEYRNAEAQRLAAYQQLDKMIAAEMAKYDPKGATALQLAQMRQANAANSAKAAEVQRQQARKEVVEDADYEIKMLDIAKKRVDLKKSMAGPGRKQYSVAEQIAARKAGATIGPDGILTFSQTAEKSPEERKAEADATIAEQTAIDKRNDLVVRDYVTGEPLGNADTPEKAKAATAAQAAYHEVVRDAERLKVLRSKIGMTIDNRILRGAENDARVAEYNSIADRVATNLVKLDDPTSIVSSGEREAAKKTRVPMYNTLTGEGPEAAEAKHKAMLDMSRGKAKGAMTSSNIKFDPTSYYPDESAADPTPNESANRAAGAYRPEQFEGKAMRMPDGTEKMIPGNKYLLNDIQVDMPIRALENAAKSGDDEALRYLQAISKNPEHQAAAQAQAAIDRLTVKP
jgi:hypothetical protein